MADHSKPAVTDLYTDYTSNIKGRLDDIAKGMDPAVCTPTNVPTDTIRWSSVSNKWEKYNGTAWVDLTATYAINISGNAATATTVSTNPSHTGDVTSGGDGVTTIANNAVTNEKLRDSGACSVMGRSANTTGDPADIAAGANDRLLARVSNALQWVQLTIGMIADKLITYAKIQDVSATDKVLGRQSAGAGVIEEIAFTTYARQLCDDTSFSAMRTTLGIPDVLAGYVTGSTTLYTGDMNALTAFGAYAIGGTATNAPSVNNGNCIVFPNAGGNLTQLYFRTPNTVTPEMWYRTYGVTTAGWSSWIRLLDTEWAPITQEYYSAAQTITSAGALTLAHNFGERPKVVSAELHCTVADAGYAVGDVLAIDAGYNVMAGVGVGHTIIAGTLNLTVRFGDNANVYRALHKTTGVITALANGSWQVRFRALA